MSLHSHNHGEGYWGKPTSILDFCEPNYAVTYYIAEFFNTLSSIPFVFWGLLGMALTHRFATTEFKFKLCYISLMIIGFGSSLFHASLQFKYQLLDEMPMLLFTTCGLYCVLTLEAPPGEHNWKLAFTLISITLIEVILYVGFKVWSIFFIGFSHNVLIATFVMFKWYRHLVGKYIFYALIAYYMGFCCWLADMFACDAVQKFHLHSLWHLGAGYGSYLGLMVVIIARASFLRKRSEVHLYTMADIGCNKEIMEQFDICIDVPLVHYVQYHEGQKVGGDFL